MVVVRLDGIMYSVLEEKLAPGSVVFMFPSLRKCLKKRRSTSGQVKYDSVL